MPDVRHKRGTRAAINALAAGNELVPGQVYVITDEAGRLAVATAVGAYSTTAMSDELASAQPRLIVSRDAGGGFGDSFQNIGSGFTPIAINNVELDTAQGWAAPYYRIPKTGLWDCSAKLRYNDLTTNASFGLGIDTADRDSASFVWDTFPSGSTNGSNRFVLQNRRVAFFNEGDFLRIFSYFDGSSGNVNKAALTAVFMG